MAARYLGGTREVKIVDTGERPTLELQVIAPVADMAAAASPDRAPRTSEAALPPSERGGMWPAIYPRLLELILAHRSTIVFVNSRRLAERLAQQLCELHAATSAEPTDEPAPGPVGPALVRAHHGSISRHEREHIEGELKAGRLRAITATSSLELGIDMGAVDLVVQLESPGSVARGLQRIGRANHHIGGAPRGRMIPKFRGDLLEMAAVTAAMLRGEVEPLTIPENCLDVLAQQVVAMCSWESWPVDELALVLRRSASYAGLGDAALTSVLDMLSGRYPSDELTTLRPRLTWDRPSGVLTARRGARMLAVTNAGTISDRGLYPVMLGDGGPRIGELDEEMVHESRPGETFLLGASTWRIEQITRDRVIVSPAPGEPGKMPFWRGDRPGRPVELGLAMGALCRRVELALRQEQEPALLANLEAQHCFDPPAAQNLLAYVAQELAAAGAVPTDEVIVVERFRDEIGDWRVCLLSPLGARVLAPWAMLLQHTLQARLGYPVHPSYTDDGIALRFPDGDAGPKDEDLFPDPDLAEEVLWAELPRTAMFAGHFRENAARALLLPRRRPGQRTPLWSQRLRAQQLMGVALRYPAFPIVLETFRECLRDVFDVPALLRVLQEVRARTLRVESVVTRAPSPFARSLAFNYVAAYLYEGDAPMAERRAAALSLDRGLLRELLGERELGALLDPRVIEEVERELQGLEPRRARDADELWDLLQRLGDLSDEELAARYAGDAGDAGDAVRTLAGAGRALLLPLAGGAARWIASEDAARYRDALGVELPQGLPAERMGPVPDALPGLLARYARNHGPFEADDLARRYGVDAALIEGALDVLVERGQLERGSFLPAARGPTLCDVEVLRRVRRGSLTRARQAIAAVSPTQFSRFVLRWHGIAGDSPRASVRRHGLPAPVSYTHLTLPTNREV